MPENKFVNIREAIVQLVDETSDEYNRALPVLVRWAKQADLRIGSYYSYKKNYYLRTVENKQVQLPLSTVHVLGVVLGNQLEFCPDIFNSLSTITRQSTMMVEGVDYVFKWDDTTNFWAYTRFNWEVQDNCIVMPGSFADGQEVTIATMNYQEDSDGFPMILEGHVQAVANYLKIKLAKKEQWKSFLLRKLTNIERAFIKDLEADYRFEVRQAIANDAPWTDEEITTLSEMMGHPYTGNGSFNLY